MTIHEDITIGNCRLIRGDMREVLPELKAKANLCLSDPPYMLTSGGQKTGQLGGCFATGKYDNSGALFDMVDWSDMAPLIYDALADNADAIIMTSDREETRARVDFERFGFAFHRLLVWDKGTATPNRWYMPNCEFGMYLYKGKARVINDCGSKALIRCPQKDVSHLYISQRHLAGGGSPHPTEKPVQLMAYWMGNSTAPGDLVLDPFMGSGSTIVAAAQTGRAAIGIEKDPKWFQVACRRVADVAQTLQSDLPLNGPQNAVQGALAV